MTTDLLETDVMNACRTLFGPEPDISRGFLLYLQPSGAKSAYRKKAKETHPDFYYTEDFSVQQQQAEQFRSVSDAYDIVNKFFAERQNGRWNPSADTGPEHSRQKSHWHSSPEHRASDNQNSAYYRGPLPHHFLEIGRYLYYSGHISYGDLIKAIMWQRYQRPIIGSVALRWGWLINPSIEAISSASNLPGRFGEKAVRLGLLSDFQVKTLLYYQRSQQERLGKYFILNNILTSGQLDNLVNKLSDHNSAVWRSQKISRKYHSR
jgi:hypothetical protein